MSRWLNFEQHSVLVVGGTSGINLGIAEAFAEHGATVAVASRSQDKVDAAVSRLSTSEKTAHGFAADVRDPDQLEAGLASIADKTGPIDTLIVGQAGNFPAAAMEMSPRAFKSVVDIDLLGSFNVVRLAGDYMNSDASNIITISAPQATVPMAMQSHVCAAKAGVEMLTRCLCIELGAHQVRVNGIIPGPIEGTEGMDRLAPNDQMQQMVRDTVPMKRFGTPREVANCALFLASPLAEYISGAIIPVDGGWSVSGAGASVLGQGLGRKFRGKS